MQSLSLTCSDLFSLPDNEYIGVSAPIIPLESKALIDNAAWEKVKNDVYELIYSGNNLGEDFETLNIDILNSALSFIEMAKVDLEIPPPVRFVVSPLGNVAFEWQSEGGVYIEAEIEEPGIVDWMMELPKLPTKHFSKEIPNYYGAEGVSTVDAGIYRVA